MTARRSQRRAPACRTRPRDSLLPTKAVASADMSAARPLHPCTSMTVGPSPQLHPMSREPSLSANIRCAGAPATSGSRGSRRLGVRKILTACSSARPGATRPSTANHRRSSRTDSGTESGAIVPQDSGVAMQSAWTVTHAASIRAEQPTQTRNERGKPDELRYTVQNLLWFSFFSRSDTRSAFSTSSRPRPRASRCRPRSIVVPYALLT